MHGNHLRRGLNDLTNERISEGDTGEVATGGLVAAGSDAAPQLEPVEAAFDDIASLVGVLVESAGSPASGPKPGTVLRMTVREAVKTLEAHRVVRVERGRGTFANPLNRWTSMEAVLGAASEGENAAASVQLIDLCRMLGTGSSNLTGQCAARG